MKAEFRTFLTEKDCLEKFEKTLFEETGFAIDDFCKITKPYDYILGAFKWKDNESKCWAILNNEWYDRIDSIIENDYTEALRLNEEVNGRLRYYDEMSKEDAYDLAIIENCRR